MCQYASQDGVTNARHLVNLGSGAVGGAGLVMVEATAVRLEGRSIPSAYGIWADLNMDAFAPIATFVSEQGDVAGIQSAHANRNGSGTVPWRGGKPLAKISGDWHAVAPSALS